MTITYAIERNLSVSDFKHVLMTSGLAARRPVEDEARLEKMLVNSNLTIAARDAEGQIVGLARCVTDFAYCCYCSDLAVDAAAQGKGIGKQLLVEVVKAAPDVKSFLLTSAPGAVSFYEQASFERIPDTFYFHRNS